MLFAYPCRLSDMVPRFGRSVPEISLILTRVTKHVDWGKPAYLEKQLTE